MATKLKTVGSAKKTVIKKNSAKKVKTVGSLKLKPKSKSIKVAGTDALMKQGRAIIAKINKMEADYKKENNRELKRLLAMAINGEHKKLSLVEGQMKNYQ